MKLLYNLEMALPTASFFLFLVLLPDLTTTSHMCEFPPDTLMLWKSHVMAGGSHDLEYLIKRTMIEIYFQNIVRKFVRWHCVMRHNGKFLVKREDHYTNSYFRCVRLHVRSKSILQISWSHESKTFDFNLCSDSFLMLDPWPLVQFKFIEKDYTQCPISGGFNMKIWDSENGENGCNQMHRPMRMEVECVGGDGVVFDYISDVCLPGVNMFVKQKTTSVAAWKDDKNHYVILRRNEDTDLWCLVVPIKKEERTTAYLYNDLICQYSKYYHGFVLKDKKKVRHLRLELEKRVFSSLCEDEYSECTSVRCNAYVEEECMRSCNACNGTQNLPDCNFPRGFRGSWFLKESDTMYRHITISQSDFSIQDVGNFHCAKFPHSLPRKSRTFSTVSFNDNGCRPRYTCVKINRLAPSVLQYSLSQSYTWPSVKNYNGKSICDPSRFEADPSPIDDTYRSHSGTGKPIIAQNLSPTSVSCNMSNIYSLTATLPDGYVCSGSMYQHCEDDTKIRLDFSSCGGLITMVSDFRCLATFEGHYWEQVILVQNIDDGMDVRCFVFNSFYPNEAYVMVASQCDKKSFNFARSRIRQPLLSLKFRQEDAPCYSVPPVLPPTVASAMVKTTSSNRSGNSMASGHSFLSQSNRTHSDQGHHVGRIHSQGTIQTSSADESTRKQIYKHDGDGEDSSKSSFDSNRRSSAQSKSMVGNNMAVILTLLLYCNNMVFDYR